MNEAYRWGTSKQNDDIERNAGLGRSGLSYQGRTRAQTPDDIDRYDQYLPLVEIDRRWAMWLSVVATAGFTGGILLLWWFSQP